MYDYYFQLNFRPFDLAPDPKFLFMTEQHLRAASNVRFALMNHDSFVIITGEIGTGKTTVLNSALQQLGSQYVTARIVHTTLTDVELLQALLSEFGLADYRPEKVRLLDSLRAFFLEQHLAGRHVVIIVDEAQHLSSAALEELRLLSCIDACDRRIVSIVLMGQPSLDDVLDDPSLTQLRQRARLRQRLGPLTAAETAQYIRHRLEVAGGDADQVFAPDTFDEIHRLTLGTPRLINTLCDTALTACMVDKRKVVDLPTIQAVVEELGWQWADASGRRKKAADEPQPAQPPAEVPPSLQVLCAGQPLRKVEIRSVPFSIGRGPGNNLVIDQLEISRRHALIERVDGRYVLEDLQSSNGLTVNGQRRETAVLQSGDVIGIGHAKLVFSTVDDVGEETGEHEEIAARTGILRRPDLGAAETRGMSQDSFATGTGGLRNRD
jgi:type II secretory pathway predicted ATPase ExeA